MHHERFPRKSPRRYVPRNVCVLLLPPWRRRLEEAYGAYVSTPFGHFVRSFERYSQDRPFTQGVSRGDVVANEIRSRGPESITCPATGSRVQRGGQPLAIYVPVYCVPPARAVRTGRFYNAPPQLIRRAVPEEIKPCKRHLTVDLA